MRSITSKKNTKFSEFASKKTTNKTANGTHTNKNGNFILVVIRDEIVSKKVGRKSSSNTTAEKHSRWEQLVADKGKYEAKKSTNADDDVVVLFENVRNISINVLISVMMIKVVIGLGGTASVLCGNHRDRKSGHEKEISECACCGRHGLGCLGVTYFSSYSIFSGVVGLRKFLCRQKFWKGGDN